MVSVVHFSPVHRADTDANELPKAGTVMYQEARRLGDLVGLPGVSYSHVATLQCQSYLAATNALSLVPKDHAWLAIVAGEVSLSVGLERPGTN